MTNDLFTAADPWFVAVASTGVRPFNFGPAMNEGDTIATASATLERTNAATSGLVTGFVTSVVVDGLKADVTWNAAVLIRGASYVLRVQANLTGGVVKVPLYTWINAF